MLVLSRKVDEQIQIGPDITIMVVSVNNERVRIGIQAPPSVTVMRPDAINKEPPPERTRHG